MKNGLSTYLYAEIDESTGKYGEVKKLSGAISYKEALTKNSAPVYSDNILKFKDTSVTGGTLSLEVDDDSPEVFNPLLGRAKKSVSGQEVYAGNSNDISVPIGFGFVENDRTQAGAFFTVNFYPKITFEPYDKENATKKESAEYKSTTVTGTLYCTTSGDYNYNNRYNTMLEALTVLYGLFGAEVPEELKKQYAEETEEGTDGGNA